MADKNRYLPSEPSPSYFDAAPSTSGFASAYSSTSSTSRLFALGGKTATHDSKFTISEYKPNLRKWESKFSMSPKWHSFGVASIGSKIFIVGGSQPEWLREIKSHFDMYDCKTNTFHNHMLPKLPCGRTGCSAAALNGSIFVSGGMDQSAEISETTSDMQRFDFQQNRWLKMKSMLRPRIDHTMLAHRDRLYAIGGHPTIRTFIEEFHPDRNLWVEVGLTARPHFSAIRATVHEDSIYACGKKFFYMFQLESLTSVTLPLPPNIRYNSLVSYQGKLLAIGGCLGRSTIPTQLVHQFDPRNRKWIRQPDMEISRKHHCTVVVEY